MVTDRRVVMIANPTSGRGRGGRICDAVRQLLERGGVGCDVVLTQRAGDADRIAREACSASSYETIVACGGDGTIQQIASVLAERRASGVAGVPSLGLAPAGRCNDFARVLGVKRDAQCIAGVLLHGAATPVDLGRVNGRYFCTIATLGIDAEISSFVDTMRMPLRGTPAYLYGAIRMLLRYRAKRIRVCGDFGEIERELFLASTANTSSYGGAIPIVPGALPTDGVLDLCLIDRVSRMRALLLIPVIMAGKHVGRPNVTVVQSRSFRFTADQPVELWADGERIGTTPATVEVAPNAIEVLVPSR